MRRKLSTVLLLCATLAACGGGGGGAGSQSPPKAPGIAGLERAISQARGAVATSVQDARRASATDAGQ